MCSSMHNARDPFMKRAQFASKSSTLARVGHYRSLVL
jgi:hypothetical protein